MSVRPVPALPGAGQARPLGLHDSWWTISAAAVTACLALTTCVWVSLHLHTDPALRTAALFVHLACLVLGFGAVMVTDYYGLLWISRRCTLSDALGNTARLHVPIWAGLAGLVLSGTLLHPDLNSTLTRTKLALILALTVNGLQAGRINRRMAQQPATPRLLAWGGATALISQICWWGAVAIGFRNSQH
ncbi:hypothetical protein [Streptomyces sp. NPDC050145]|uniref:hypothetical protein n=1 Tax=Streptomyces sp. NPDC050145 TaxID=3365602 RepID=UPI00379847AE